MSTWQIDCSLKNVQSTKCTFGEMYTSKMYFGQIPFGEMPMCPDTVVITRRRYSNGNLPCGDRLVLIARREKILNLRKPGPSPNLEQS